MSISFRPLASISMRDLFDGRLDNFGIREHAHEETSREERCLTDGQNFLWVYSSEEGFVSLFSAYALITGNVVIRILQTIREEFDVEIVNESEPQFWGFETTAEWEAAEGYA